jgi:hypothetical protein
MSEQRIERSGLSAKARKSSLLDEWDAVRAAQHMLEVHGKEAIAIAERRADAAADLNAEKRWRTIASTIREVEHGS